MLIVLAILILIILMILASCVKIVPQTTALVIERLGAYNGTWKVGIHFKEMCIRDRHLKLWKIRIRLHSVVMWRLSLA